MTAPGGAPTGAELVATAVDRLRDLLQQLAALLPDPVGDPTVGTTAHRKHVAGSPAPWHAEAGAALMTIHEGVRRLEASMRLGVTGHTGQHRGGSDGNTLRAMHNITRLAYGVSDQGARRAARHLTKWADRAATIRDIDQEPRWDPLLTASTSRTGVKLPPVCPYCRTLSLRIARAASTVRCFNPRCRDSAGNHPSGVISETDGTHRPMIVWADGRTIVSYTTEAS